MSDIVDDILRPDDAPRRIYDVTSTRMPLLDAAVSARFLSRETAQHMLMHHARMVTK